MADNSRVQDLMNGRRKSVKVHNGKLVTVEEEGAVRQSLGTLRRISWNEVILIIH